MRKAKGLVLRSDSSFAVPFLSGRRKDVLRRVAFTPLEGPRLAGTQIRIPNRQSGRFLAGFVSPKDSFRRRKLSNRAAFTLIELLVVISIVVLLMAILLPTLQRVRNQARAVVCQTNLKQWGTVLALYTEDSQGRLPGGTLPAVWLLRDSYLREDDPNKPPLYHDIRTQGIACCPMAVRVMGGRTHAGSGSNPLGTWKIQWTRGSAFRAWEITSPSPPFRGSYGFNYELFKFGGGPAYRPPGGLDVYSFRRKARYPLLLDCTNWSGYYEDRPPLSEPVYSDWPRFCINRHNGHVNGLFLDWSVRKIGLKELWTLKWHMDFDTAGRWTTAGGALPEDWPQWMRGFKDY